MLDAKSKDGQEGEAGTQSVQMLAVVEERKRRKRQQGGNEAETDWKTETEHV